MFTLLMHSLWPFICSKLLAYCLLRSHQRSFGCVHFWWGFQSSPLWIYHRISIASEYHLWSSLWRAPRTSPPNWFVWNYSDALTERVWSSLSSSPDATDESNGTVHRHVAIMNATGTKYGRMAHLCFVNGDTECRLDGKPVSKFHLWWEVSGGSSRSSDMRDLVLDELFVCNFYRNDNFPRTVW